MRRPYSPKTDPVIISTTIGVVLLVFGLAIGFEGSGVRSLRMRIQQIYGGQLVHLDTMWSDSEAHATCGLYSTPPSQKQWRYLDDLNVTWAEGRMRSDATLADVLPSYDRCIAYRSFSRAGTGAAFSPLKLAIANWR